MAPALELILMNKSGIKYAEAAKLIAQCRSSLGMTRFEPWNEALQVECERVLANDQRDGIKLVLKKGLTQAIDETSISDCDGAVVPGSGVPLPPVSASPLHASARKPTIMESFFGISNISTSTQTATNPNQEVSEVPGDVVSQFFGQRVESVRRPTMGSVASSSSLPSRVSLSSNSSQTSHSRSKKRRAKKASKPVRLKATSSIPPGRKDTRENHLTDPSARSTPLEALMLRRFDLTYQDAVSLVADARANLSASRCTPWTDELYNECERLNEFHHPKETTSAKDLGNKESANWPAAASSNGNSEEQHGAPLRAPREEDFASVKDDNSCDQSSGWESASGWSSIWDDNDGDFSVATHDRDDVYSVGVIKEFKLNFEKDAAHETEYFVTTKKKSTETDEEKALRREKRAKKHALRAQQSTRSRKTSSSRESRQLGPEDTKSKKYVEEKRKPMASRKKEKPDVTIEENTKKGKKRSFLARLFGLGRKS